jgi:mRNA-degrading endonuclease toxin of MazEF toxin-antitoxin module
MGRFVKGEVVVSPFPFSDLSSNKRRPALVVASLEGSDVILCQITSQAISDRYAVPLAVSDFATGSLRKPSNVRPNRLFTADSHVILYRAGKVTNEKMREVTEKILQLLSES